MEASDGEGWGGGAGDAEGGGEDARCHCSGFYGFYGLIRVDTAVLFGAQVVVLFFGILVSCCCCKGGAWWSLKSPRIFKEANFTHSDARKGCASND